MLRKIKNIIQNKKFDSKNFWESRYQEGGTSGSGSYNQLAEFKAEFLNDFVSHNKIESVIEFGCGDGNQLKMAQYPKYIGLDVSITAIQTCVNLFIGDSGKSFFLYDYRAFVDNQRVFSSDLSLSLDVIYHLVEQKVYESYLIHLFSSAEKFVIIYSSDEEIAYEPNSHEFRRKFTSDVERLIKGWELTKVVENKFPSKLYGNEQGSFSDFYIYSKISG